MKTKKVLIVEDNELNRKLFENLIGQIFQFESVQNGVEALVKLENEKFDLILMDIQMPYMDGITAIRKIIQQKISDCPIIAISAYAEESERENFLQLGFQEFISKPIRPREFLEVVNRTIQNNFEKKEKSENDELILDKNIVDQLMKFNTNDSIKKVYNDFTIECDEIWNSVQISLKDNQLKAIAEKLHILKGNSGTLGANKIYFLSQIVEKAAKTEDLQTLLNYLPNLKKEIDSFQLIIKEETTFNL
jgi:two-component system, OmpR family, alkaline phosphatase synthesis response regulator PhoP